MTKLDTLNISKIIKEETNKLFEYKDNNFRGTLLKCEYTLNDLYKTLIAQGADEHDYTLVGLEKIIREISKLANSVNTEKTDWKRRNTLRF